MDQRRDPGELEPADGKTPADVIDTSSAPAARHSVFTIAKHVYHGMNDAHLTTQAQSVAYNFIFAIVPLLIFITALAATISRNVYSGTGEAVQKIINQVSGHLPANSQQLVADLLRQAISQAGGGAISIGALLALIGARGAMASLVSALNAAYEVKETRGFIRRQLLAIGLTIGTGLALIVAVAIFVLGDRIGQLIAGPLKLGDAWATVWAIARFPLVLVMLVIALAILYWAGPNTKITFRWLTPGAIFAVVAWVVVTLFLNVYFTYAGSYASTYGAFGGVLAFIFYLFVISFIVLIGGQINASITALAIAEQRDAGAQTSDADEPRQKLLKEAASERRQLHDAITAARHSIGASGSREVAADAASSPARAEQRRHGTIRALAAAAAASGAGLVATLLGRRH